jgi:hypothetical protein
LLFPLTSLRPLPTPEQGKRRSPDPKCPGLNVIVTSGGARRCLQRPDITAADGELATDVRVVD